MRHKISKKYKLFLIFFFLFFISTNSVLASTLNDAILTAVYRGINRIVTFEAPTGTLTPADILISVPSGDSLNVNETIPTASPNHLSYEFSHWRSSDSSHPNELSTEDLAGLIINQDTVFTAIFRRVFIPITAVRLPHISLTTILVALTISSINIWIYSKYRGRRQ